MSATENTNPSVTKENKEKKPKKVKVDKYNGFKVPAKSSVHQKSIIWAYHVYSIMKEAKPALLEREDIKVAYNNFVDCLNKYKENNPNQANYGLTSWLPSKKNKYKSGIIPDVNLQSPEICFTKLPFSISYSTYQFNNNLQIREKRLKAYQDIITVYTVLYDLIKRDVVPFMELKNWEINSNIDINDYRKIMVKIENENKYYQEMIDNNLKTIAEITEKCVALQIPPEVTKFD